MSKDTAQSIRQKIAHTIQEEAFPFQKIEEVDLSGFLQRVGNSKVVLLGEATHGTSEFYAMRAKITRELIQHKGFTFVALEADWPDTARVHRYICHLKKGLSEEKAFTRFPIWMWRNHEFHDFVEWLREYNKTRSDISERIGMYGLDLYSLNRSIDAVISYLNHVDPNLAHEARQRYGCLSPWKHSPEQYGLAMLTGRYKECEKDVIAILEEMLIRRLESIQNDSGHFLEALQNARLVVSAERYYRTLYSSLESSWNLRDTHMFETLKALLNTKGKQAKAVVWAHNSHIGDASATEMNRRGEFNLGQLCRQEFGQDAYLVGFGTDRGTVAAASDWGEPMEVKDIVPSSSDSYERLFYESGLSRCMLPLRQDNQMKSRKALLQPRLERAIGVIYRPEAERISHYFYATLPEQFDEYIWFNETKAVAPLEALTFSHEMPETYPFGL